MPFASLVARQDRPAPTLEDILRKGLNGQGEVLRRLCKPDVRGSIIPRLERHLGKKTDELGEYVLQRAQSYLGTANLAVLPQSTEELWEIFDPSIPDQR